LLEHLQRCSESVSGLVVDALAGTSLVATPHRSRPEIQKRAAVVAPWAISTLIGEMAQFQEKGPEIQSSEDHRRKCGRSQLTSTKVKRQHLRVATHSCSAPRLWGARHGRMVDLEQLRSIPAPVGSTIYHSDIRPATTVHPRACGEHDLVE